MARTKGRSKRACCDQNSEVYWGAETYNRNLFYAYMGQVCRLAMTRYEWIGLPDTVDALWLERTLLFEGCATIARPVADGKVGLWRAAKMVSNGALNCYDRPSSWYAYARDIFRFPCNARNAVLVYDNVGYRDPILPGLEMACRELVDIQKTKQVNRFWQKLPFILVTPQDMDLTAVNLLNSIMAGEPATIANPAIRELEAYKLDMNQPYIGAELTAAEQNVWNRIYTMLGISNVTFKTERMIEDEVDSLSEPTRMQALSGLIERRRAADRLNKAFGMDVHVVWRKDTESDNINTLASIQDTAKLISGENKGLAEVMQDDTE